MGWHGPIGSCGCCGCVYLEADTSNALTKLVILDAPVDYEWDGETIPPGASIRTVKLMPDDHYHVNINVTGDGVFPLEFWTAHAKYTRTALGSSILYGGNRYWSQLTLSNAYDTQSIYDDKASTSLTPPTSPTSLTQFYVSDGMAWLIENQLSGGSFTTRIGLDAVESTTIEVPSGYYYSIEPDYLYIKNTGLVDISFSSLTVTKIRGLINSDGDRSLSFIDPLPTDEVPNAKCEEIFPDCWDVEGELEPLDVSVSPNATPQVGVFINRGCAHQSNFQASLPTVAPLVLNQYQDEEAEEILSYGTLSGGVEYDLVKKAAVNTSVATAVPTHGVLYGTLVTASVTRSSTPLEIAEVVYYPYTVNMSLKVTRSFYTITAYKNQLTDEIRTTPFFFAPNPYWAQYTSRVATWGVAQTITFFESQTFNERPLTVVQEFVIPKTITSFFNVTTEKERVTYLKVYAPIRPVSGAPAVEPAYIPYGSSGQSEAFLIANAGSYSLPAPDGDGTRVVPCFPTAVQTPFFKLNAATTSSVDDSFEVTVDL